MKRKFLLTGLLGLFILGSLGSSGCSVIVQPTPGSAQVDIGFFYDALAPYGEWFSLEGYGWVWTPYGISIGWRPYTDGRWVYTDYGWTWVSDQEWGWAPFHYGRWLFESRYGWVWIPGREWAPAWVTWRHGGGWVGWAPIPPGVDWQSRVYIESSIKPSGWCFVEERFLHEPNLRINIVPQARNMTMVRMTQNVTNYSLVQNRVINRSISAEQIEKAIQKPIPRYRIVDRDMAPKGSDRIRGNEIYMFRQPLAEKAPDHMPSRSVPATPTLPPSQRPGVGTAPPQAVPRSELLKQQETERRKLDDHLQSEGSKLEEYHRKETQRPPSGVSLEELRKQHETERRALEEQIRQQREHLLQRHEMEQKGEIQRK